MTNEKKRYKVTIFGEEYTLVSSDLEEHVQESARLVDKAMQEIVGTSANIDQRKVAVLAALRIANSMVLATESAALQTQRHEVLVATIDELFSTVLSDG